MRDLGSERRSYKTWAAQCATRLPNTSLPLLFTSSLPPPTMFSRAARSVAKTSESSLPLQQKRPHKYRRIRPANARSFSQSAARFSYEDTAKNLLIHKDTKVLCQGFTGKTVSWTFLLHFILAHTAVGYFPCSRSACVRHEDGRRCVP